MRSCGVPGALTEHGQRPRRGEVRTEAETAGTRPQPRGTKRGLQTRSPMPGGQEGPALTLLTPWPPRCPANRGKACRGTLFWQPQERHTFWSREAGAAVANTQECGSPRDRGRGGGWEHEPHAQDGRTAPKGKLPGTWPGKPRWGGVKRERATPPGSGRARVSSRTEEVWEGCAQ